MNKSLVMGVDGIISDYPDLFVHIKIGAVINKVAPGSIC